MRRLAPLAALLLSGCLGLSVRVGEPHQGGGPTLKPPPASSTGAAAAPEDSSAKKKEPLEEHEQKEISSVLAQVERQRATYRIGAADLLQIQVYQEDDLNRKVRVSLDGGITLPLIGSVKVGGLGVAEAEKVVTERYRKYLIDPQISIFISEYGNKQVYVLGEVAKPGSYPLPTEARLSVIEAITLAGGFTQYAAADRTRVIRKNPDGKSQTFLIEVSAVTKRGDKSKDILLEPNDVVYVPESLF
ncbi:MAG: polysaccharide biosynthesis/export family protein [Elusimicrobia bacterium]|nr:polysaccharide biosynthesis/export family protein [Elusimicrobiota bacterium]